MDPIGFGLENYDAVGRWRDKEAIDSRSPVLREGTPPRTIELPIDGKGEIAGLTNSAFSEPEPSGVCWPTAAGARSASSSSSFATRSAGGDRRRSRDHSAGFTAFRESKFDSRNC